MQHNAKHDTSTQHTTRLRNSKGIKAGAVDYTATFTATIKDL